MSNPLEKWKEQVFFKEYFQDISRAKLAEAQESFLKGGKWAAYTPLSESKALELLSTKHRESKVLESEKQSSIESKANIWSSFFSRQKPATKEDAPQLEKYREIGPKK